MLPTEMFSGDATKGPPWTPQVWQDGPDALIAQARADLFTQQRDLVADVLDGGNDAMSGNSTAPQNESDQVFDVQQAGQQARDSTAGDSRVREWNSAMADLRDTEPRIAGWSSGEKTGTPNPAP